MQDSKLINILKTFSADELKSFEKFIASPYFSVGRDVRGLFSVIKKSYPRYLSKEIIKENLYKKLFGSEEFNERKLKNLTASLTFLAEQFLIYSSLSTNETENELILAEQYLKRGNEKLFLSTLRSVEKKSLPLISFGDSDSFAASRKMLRLKEKFYISKNKYSDAIPVRLAHTEYSALSFYIYFFKRLKDYVIFPIFYNSPFENTILKSVKENTDFEKMMEELKSENYPMLWLIEVYYNIYKSILSSKDGKSEEYYYKTKKLFFENKDKFSRREKYYILDSLVTYCIMRDPDNNNFSLECFEIYKKMLEENACTPSEEEPLGATQYGNIMFWAFDIEEYDWLEGFIGKYSSKLKPEHEEDMTNLAMAHLYFGKRDYEKALTHISKVRNDFLLYKIQVRNLKFKIYYELGLFEQAYSLVDSYRHFLTENTEIHGMFKERAVDFINIYIRLLKAKADHNVTDVDFLRTKIEGMLGYELRPWLMEKVDELIKIG